MQNCINYSVTSRDGNITLGIQTSFSPAPLLWGGKEERTDDISDYDRSCVGLLLLRGTVERGTAERETAERDFFFCFLFLFFFNCFKLLLFSSLPGQNEFRFFKVHST